MSAVSTSQPSHEQDQAQTRHPAFGEPWRGPRRSAESSWFPGASFKPSARWCRACAIPWCSGYHVCFTRRRSPVRSRAESRLFLPRVAWAASSRLATAATSACMAGSLCRPAALSPASTPWRNGSASDSRSEGCVFKSRRGQGPLFVLLALAIARICVRSSIAEGVRERVERPPRPPAAVCPPPPR